MGRASLPARRRHNPMRAEARRRALPGWKIHRSIRPTTPNCALRASIGEGPGSWWGMLPMARKGPPRQSVDPDRGGGGSNMASLGQPRRARGPLRSGRESPEAAHDETEPLIGPGEMGEPQRGFPPIGGDDVGHPHGPALRPHPTEQSKAGQRPQLLDPEDRTDDEGGEEGPDEPPSGRRNGFGVAFQ